MNKQRFYVKRDAGTGEIIYVMHKDHAFGLKGGEVIDLWTEVMPAQSVDEIEAAIKNLHIERVAYIFDPVFLRDNNDPSGIVRLVGYKVLCEHQDDLLAIKLGITQ